MKTNLSKEHIEKGCRLVEGYEYVERPDCFMLVTQEIGVSVAEDGNVIEGYPLIYRDFLQLVIEGINAYTKTSNDMGVFQNAYCIWISWFNCGYRQQESFYFRKEPDKYPEVEITTITEAKEKAIAYVLDNMEIVK